MRCGGSPSAWPPRCGDLIAEVGDRQTLRLVEEAEAIWLAESPERGRDVVARAEWRRRAAATTVPRCRASPRASRRCAASSSATCRIWRTRGWTDRDLSRDVSQRGSSSATPSSRARRSCSGCPLALWGLLSHGRAVRADRDRGAARAPRARRGGDVQAHGGRLVSIRSPGWPRAGRLAPRRGRPPRRSSSRRSRRAASSRSGGRSGSDAWRAIRARGSTSSAIAISTATSPSGGARS